MSKQVIVERDMLADVWLSAQKLQTVVDVLKQTQRNGIKAKIGINVEGKTFHNEKTGKDNYQDVSLFIEPEGKPKFYIANGRVFWQSERKGGTADDGSQDELADQDGVDELPF